MVAMAMLAGQQSVFGIVPTLHYGVEMTALYVKPGASETKKPDSSRYSVRYTPCGLNQSPMIALPLGRLSPVCARYVSIGGSRWLGT